MSHEIRTPLNAIIGFTEAPEMGINADEVEKAERNPSNYLVGWKTVKWLEW